MSTQKSYYEVLGISLDATLEEIKRAYQREKKSFDINNPAVYSLMPPKECERILAQLDEAFNVLSDPLKRQRYHKEKNLGAISPASFEHAEPEPTLPSENETSEFNYEKNLRKKDKSVSSILSTNRFALDYQKDANFEQEIENSLEFNGPYLKKIREYKNVSLERMADLTKVSKTHLKNLEDEKASRLPASVYTRGFVFQYAKVLKLNPELVASSYMRLLSQKDS